MTKTLLFWLSVDDDDAKEARPDGWQWLDEYVTVEHWNTGSILIDGEVDAGELVRKGENPAEYFLPTDILPEPLGQNVIDAMGGLNCMGCYDNEIEESEANLTAWKNVREHLKKYPDEKDQKYSGTDYLSTFSVTGKHTVFNSVLFLTDLETWHRELKEILGVGERDG